MAEVYMKDKPEAESFSYAYVESEDGALVRVAKEKMREALGISEISEDVEKLNIIDMYICTDGEYADAGTPTVEPEKDTVYLVPDSEEPNVYTEWSYTDKGWEKGDVVTVSLEEENTIEVDATLTEEGKAADAKATGDAIKKLDDKIAETKESIPQNTSDLNNDSGFLTEHQDLSGYAQEATTLAGYGIIDGATKDEVSKLSEEIMKIKDFLGLSTVIAFGTAEAVTPAYTNVVIADGISLESGKAYAIKGTVTTETTDFAVYIMIHNEGGTSYKFVLITEETADYTNSLTFVADGNYDNMSLVMQTNVTSGLSVTATLESV